MSKVIKLGNYKGIEFKVEKVPVSNEEVEQQIQMILAQSSQTEEAYYEKKIDLKETIQCLQNV